MNVLWPVAHLATACMRAIVRALTQGFDALTGPVGRLNDRVEAHLLDRTSLLRAHYARPGHRRVAPLPGLGGPIDLALRGGIPETAASRPTGAMVPRPSAEV
ncbi:hypothetical protein ASF58_02030 [Methylobacterium sp. Leaf125]|uniref:hypothetical protein n=1 Tax=Methylobacterium sp. Leaf125 TaxID=1736265 RepID=UPI0006F6F71A|nr:hypothetical protein [Methylobacterium sp. Leaf125]KQQ48138.1 hypothetical protein ASF58_02030 [Methylobacterium sp. Leaf125]